MNDPQYRGQGYNNQNQQYNNINNQQYRAQVNNGQNPQFEDINNRSLIIKMVITILTNLISNLGKIIPIFILSKPKVY